MREAEVFISIGSNLGNRLSHMQWAVRRIEEHPDIDLNGVSGVYETEAHVKPGSPPQSAYLNAVFGLETLIFPEDLLALCLSLETRRGRRRQEDEVWQPRTLDLDLLAYRTLRSDTSSLRLPHPNLHLRRFVLEPWNEIAPSFFVTEPFDRTVSELLAACPDSLAIERTDCELLG